MKEELIKLLYKVEDIAKGDKAGHPFRGNQYRTNEQAFHHEKRNDIIRYNKKAREDIRHEIIKRTYAEGGSKDPVVSKLLGSRDALDNVNAILTNKKFDHKEVAEHLALLYKDAIQVEKETRQDKMADYHKSYADAIGKQTHLYLSAHKDFKGEKQRNIKYDIANIYENHGLID